MKDRRVGLQRILAGVAVLAAVHFTAALGASEERGPGGVGDPVRESDPRPITRTPPSASTPRWRELTPELRELLRLDPPAAARIIRERALAAGHDIKAVPDIVPATGFAVHTERSSFVPPGGAHDLAYGETRGGPITSSGVLSPFILQFARHLSLDESLSLVELGGRYLDMISDSAGVYLLPDNAVSRIASLPFVRWAGYWRPEYKFNDATLSAGRRSLYVRPLGEIDPSHLADLKALGFKDAAAVGASGLFIVPSASKDDLDSLARLWWVRAVSPVPEALPAGTINFGAVDSREFLLVSRYHGLGRDGTGVTVGIRDDGVLSTHGDLNGIFAPNSSFGDPKNHGTHVTGIVAGRGAQSSGTIVGVAPGSSVLFRTNLSGDLVTDLEAFRTGGVSASNHSYQFQGCTFYDTFTTYVDRYAEDYGQIYVASAGNENGAWGYCNGTHDSVVNPGVGKNVLTAGAVSYTMDGPSGGLGRITPYSSRGPTGGSYKRLKPDLAAPGGDPGSGPSDPNFPYGVVAPYAQVGTSWLVNLWPDYSPSYVRASGTSMAAPHVTGALALLRQWSPSSSPEAIKAQLIAMALPIRDNLNTPLNGYADVTVGYGLVNPYQSMYSMPGEWETLLWTSGTLKDSSPEEVWTITVPIGAQKVIVALAYNDVEGNGGNLVDDLDFKVELPSGVMYSSDSNGNLGCATCVNRPYPPGVDTESPVEKVVIENPSADDLGVSWTIRARFTSWPSPCIPPMCIPKEEYGLVVAAVYKTPALALEMPQTTFLAKPGQQVPLPFTVRNTGGYIIPAVGVSLSSTSTSMFLGSLAGTNDSRGDVLTLAAPATDGWYSYTVKAEGVNLGLPDATRMVDLLVDGTPPGDAQVTSPSPGVRVCGSLITQAATAHDASGTIRSVEFYLDSETTPICSDATPKPSGSTFECAWDPHSRQVGSHCVKALACDLLSNCTLSSEVCYSVTYPGAAEVNDGMDNQCEGDPGYGEIDEVSGMAGFFNPSDISEFSWDAQAGATAYRVARSGSLSFSPTCTFFHTQGTSLIDPEIPPFDLFFFYLVQAKTPHRGGWGQDSSGVERVVECE